MTREFSTGSAHSGILGRNGNVGTMDELMEIAIWQQFEVYKCRISLRIAQVSQTLVIYWVEHAIDARLVPPEGKMTWVTRNSTEESVEWLKEPLNSPYLGSDQRSIGSCPCSQYHSAFILSYNMRVTIKHCRQSRFEWFTSMARASLSYS